MCPTAFLRINREHQQIEVRKWANAIFDWIAFCSAATERMGAKVAEINRVGTDEQIGYHCPAKYRRTVVTNATHTSAHRILIFFFAWTEHIKIHSKASRVRVHALVHLLCMETHKKSISEIDYFFSPAGAAAAVNRIIKIRFGKSDTEKISCDEEMSKCTWLRTEKCCISRMPNENRETGAKNVN